MTSAIQVVISQNSKLGKEIILEIITPDRKIIVIMQYLKGFSKFAQILSISISPTSDVSIIILAVFFIF